MSAASSGGLGSRLKLAAATVALIAGCASNQVQTVPVDALQPQELSRSDLRPCQTVGPTLASGGRCFVVVHAAAWNNRTGLKVCAGQSYRVSVPGNQHWYDASRRSHPMRGDQGNGLMNSFEGLKRLGDEPWFVLVAGILPPSASIDDAPVNMAALKSSADLPPVSTYTVKSSGELVFFANDAAMPFWKKLFYGNNSGRAWVVVQLVGPSCV